MIVVASAALCDQQQDAARTTLQTILRFDPCPENAQQMLQTLGGCRTRNP